jgi:hypothetical protein
MTKLSVKIVRPWPAEQPRPPVVHRVGSLNRTMPEPANTPRKTSRPAA